MGKKKKEINICPNCNKSKRPAINAARLGHENCLIVAYRVLGVLNQRDDYGATPIHYAARHGKVDCLHWLVVNSGISPNAAARNGATAAHDAAAMGHLNCLKYLLENTQCSPTDATTEGATVLHIACRFGQAKVTEWLLENSVALPCEKGVNDVTPLHICAAKNTVNCIKLLTQNRRYIPNEQTVHGATPLYFAAQEGSVECLEWLLKHGKGDPNISATDGMSAIHAAAQAGNIKCLQVLVEHGVSPNTRSHEGATPAHYAAASGRVKCLQWILDNGGSITDKDDLGGIPLHDAADQGQTEAVAFLIKKGTPVNVEDFDGLKPYDLAKENNHQRCMKLLFNAATPDILTSITPHHSLSRASQCSDDDKKNPTSLEKNLHLPQIEETPRWSANDTEVSEDATFSDCTSEYTDSKDGSAVQFTPKEARRAPTLLERVKLKKKNVNKTTAKKEEKGETRQEIKQPKPLPVPKVSKLIVPVEVHISNEKKRFEEQAIITSTNIDDTSACEEVSVTFQEKTSLSKKSFPITHQQLIHEDDLSSPEESDEEEADEDDYTDFKPLSKAEFDNFGKLIVPPSIEEEQIKEPIVYSIEGEPKMEQEVAPRGEHLPVDDNASESSDDTMIFHEEETDDSLIVALNERINSIDHRTEVQFWNERSGGIPRSSSSSRLRIPLAIAEEEEEEEEEKEEEEEEEKKETVREVSQPIQQTEVSKVTMEEGFPLVQTNEVIDSRRPSRNSKYSVYSPLLVSLSASDLHEKKRKDNTLKEDEVSENEDTPPVVTEDTPAIITEDTLLLVTEDTLPLVIEETPPLVTEETPPLVTEETPVATEDLPPVVTEDLPEVTEDTPPVVTENMSVVIEDAPIVIETIVTDENAPIINDENTPSNAPIENTPVIPENTPAANENTPVIPENTLVVVSGNTVTNSTSADDVEIRTSLMQASEDTIEDNTPMTLTPSEVDILRKRTISAVNKVKSVPKQIFILIEVEGVQTVGIHIPDDSPIINVIFKAINRAGVDPHLDISLFETSDSLKYERHLEEHELIRDITINWPKKNPPRFVLRIHETKHSLWTIPQFSVAQYFKNGQVPSITSSLLFSRGGKILKWKTESFTLMSTGILLNVNTSDKKKKSSTNKMICSIDECFYTLIHGMITSWNKREVFPTPFGFLIKPLNSWKKKDMKLFCCDDYPTFSMWINGFRLLKHGLQLKANYIATNARVQKR